MNQKSKAYKLSSPKDSKAFYNDWASRYDTDFYDDIDRENRGYPKKVANIYFQMAKNDNTPIADIGCGTGALGKHFMSTNFIIDWFDISSGMLSEAKKKGYYRNLYECDLTKTEQLPKQKYRGLISCGTFTFGHLGPAYLLGIIQMLKKGGLGVLGVNKGHYLTNGFENEIRNLESSSVLNNLKFFKNQPVARKQLKTSKHSKIMK